MNNKQVFANNLKRIMNINGKSRYDVCEALDFNYYTYSDWVNGKKFPRMDKVEKLANYFGVLISDLIEDKGEAHFEMLQEINELNDIMSWIKSDAELLKLMKKLRKAPEEKKILIKSMLAAMTESIED